MDWPQSARDVASEGFDAPESYVPSVTVVDVLSLNVTVSIDPKVTDVASTRCDVIARSSAACRLVASTDAELLFSGAGVLTRRRRGG